MNKILIVLAFVYSLSGFTALGLSEVEGRYSFQNQASGFYEVIDISIASNILIVTNLNTTYQVSYPLSLECIRSKEAGEVFTFSKVRVSTDTTRCLESIKGLELKGVEKITYFSEALSVDRSIFFDGRKNIKTVQLNYIIKFSRNTAKFSTFISKESNAKNVIMTKLK